MIKKYSLHTTQKQQGQRLDQALAEWLPEALKKPVSKGKVRKLVVAGAVYLNGRRVRIASKELMARVKIDVYIDARKLFEEDGRARDRAFEMTQDRVLFEDAYLIVVNKPAGLPTQPTLDEARDNLFASVKKFIAARDQVTDPYLALHHRLDRDTSGVLLFAKAKEANAGVAKIFSEHLARKVYQAIVALPPRKTPLPEWTVRDYLGKLPGAGKQAKYGAVKSGGDAAHTDFRVLELLRDAAWIEAKPLTGRTHQIRVHLSEAGFSILGDSLYADSRVARLAPRLMLHAVSLTFPHPVHKTEVSVQCLPPEDFQKCLLTLGRGDSPAS